MKYHYIIFKSSTGYSIDEYYGTYDGALAYIRRIISCVYFGGKGWIQSISDNKLTDEEQDYLLLDAMCQ